MQTRMVLTSILLGLAVTACSRSTSVARQTAITLTAPSTTIDAAVRTPSSDPVAMYRAQVGELFVELDTESARLDALVSAATNGPRPEAPKLRAAGDALARSKSVKEGLDAVVPPPCAGEYHRRLTNEARLYDAAVADTAEALRSLDTRRIQADTNGLSLAVQTLIDVFKQVQMVCA